MEHVPSLARRLAAQAKEGRPPEPLVRHAAALPDPYHAAWALAAISALPTVPPALAQEAVETAFERAARVSEAWRRAELAAHLAKQAEGWQAGRRGLEPVAARLPDFLMELAAGLPPSVRAAAVEALAPRLPRARLPGLLALALEAGAEPAKHVLAAWAAAPPGPRDPQEGAADLGSVLATVPPGLRARLLGHLHLQARRHGRGPGFDALGQALAAAQAAGPDRTEALRYLAQAAGTEAWRVVAAARGEDDAGAGAAETLCRVLAAAATQADRDGRRSQAAAWLREAAVASAGVAEERARANVRRNVAQGLARLGLAAEAAALVPSGADAAGGAGAAVGAEPADADAADAAVPVRMVAPSRSPAAAPTSAPAPPATPAAPSSPAASSSPAPRSSPAAPSPPAAPVSEPQVEAAPTPVPPRKRPALALHNSYDGGLSKVHLQAVARAAPLAVGFGFDLALVGFPVADAAALAAAVQADTRIGEGAPLVARLVAQERLHLVPRALHHQPAAWPLDAEVVALTQDPAPGKEADLGALLAGERRVCLVMGLGHRGLPPQLLQACRHHLELTGARVPLETATVMGVVAQRLRERR